MRGFPPAAWPILLVVGLTQCARAPKDPPAPDSSRGRDTPPPVLVTSGARADSSSAAGRRPTLRTAIDLFESFAQGQGTLRADASRRPVAASPARGLLSPVPWTVAEPRQGSAGLFVLSEGVNSDAMLAFVLHDGESWDVPVGRLGAGSRLRFEAMSRSGDARPELTVDVTGDRAPARVLSFHPPPASLEPREPTSVDVPVPSDGTDAVVSFRVSGGDVAIGEARILAPDPEGGTPYPWVVLTIGDALRADALGDDPALSRGAPALRAFASAGQRFTRAVTPGCHTRASVWSLMSGRDMMRIDPCLRGGVNTRFAGAELIHRFGNLFFTQYAWRRGYHTVFLGNNAFFGTWPGFQRIKLLGSADSGTDETIAALPWFFARYADERVVAVYYVSATHSRSTVPARLVQRLGCDAKSGVEADVCRYAAKVAHFDEALVAFERGLAEAGLSDRTLRILTADHGENVEHTSGVEAEVNGPGHWFGVTVGHGVSCYAAELQVPLVIMGPSVPRGQVATRVSSLDIAPTVLEAIGVTVPTELDGRPLRSSTAASPSLPSASSDRLFASYGFCTDSFVRRETQFVHWLPDCGRRRLAATGGLLGEADELWQGGRRTAHPPADVLATWRDTRWRWIRERIPSPALMIELGGVGRADLSITATGGATISDFGPSNTVYGLDRITIRREDPSTVRLRADHFSGRIFVSTEPALAPVRIRLEGPDTGATAMVALVGQEQLPVTLDGRELDPGAHRTWLVADRRPGEPGALAELPKLWWQTYSLQQATAHRQAVEGFGRVLREWGYIR